MCSATGGKLPLPLNSRSLGRSRPPGSRTVSWECSTDSGSRQRSSVAFAVGVITVSHVWLTSARALREGSLAEYQVEQEFLASRSAREGDLFREAVHRLNVADAQAGIGFQWLVRSKNESYWDWFRFPWESY